MMNFILQMNCITYEEYRLDPKLNPKLNQHLYRVAYNIYWPYQSITLIFKKIWPITKSQIDFTLVEKA